MQAVTGLTGGRGRRRRLAAAAVGCALAFGCLWLAQASRGDDIEANLLVYANGEQVETISTEELNENVNIDIRRVGGAGLTSVAEVARLSGIPPDHVVADGAAVIEGLEGLGAGQSVTLNGSEVLESADSGAGFRMNSSVGQIVYEQPGTSINVRGVNPIRIDFSFVGQVLKVNLSCAPMPVTAGTAVKCKAEPKEGSAAGWAYSWKFGDGSVGEGGTGPEAEYVYANAGTYKVEVEARSGEEDSGTGHFTVRVEASEPPAGDPPPAGPPTGPGRRDDEAPPGPTSEPKSERAGSGEAPPESVATGPDESQASKTSEGRRTSKKQRRKRAPEPEPAVTGLGSGGSPGSGGGAGTSVGTGPDASGGGTGPGAAGPDADGAPLEELQSEATFAPRGKVDAEVDRRDHQHPGRAGPLVEGLLLTRASGAGAPFDTAAASPQEADRLQQAAGGQGSGGSALGPLVGVTALLIALAVGGGVELVSAGRRATWILGAGS